MLLPFFWLSLVFHLSQALMAISPRTAYLYDVFFVDILKSTHCWPSDKFEFSIISSISQKLLISMVSMCDYVKLIWRHFNTSKYNPTKVFFLIRQTLQGLYYNIANPPNNIEPFTWELSNISTWRLKYESANFRFSWYDLVVSKDLKGIFLVISS